MTKKSFQTLLSEKKINEILQDDASKEKEFNKKIQFYHGRSMNRKRTEALLKSKDAKPGSFLLRDSFSSHGDFVLSLRFDTSDKKPAVEHYKIMKNKYDIYYRIHTSRKTDEIHGIENFITFYQKEKHGLPVKLEKPITKLPPPPESMSVGRTNALHHAIQAGVKQNILTILNHKKCPNINSRDSEGTPALHMACRSGITEVVELMIRNRVKVATKDKDGFSALHIACMENRSEIVKLLLDLGNADPVDIRKQDRSSAMHYAAAAGSVDSVRVLIKYGAPNRPRNMKDEVPYDLAVENNQKDIINFLNNYETVVDPVIKRSDWLHETESRAGATNLIHSIGATDGIFLIRKSSKGDTYALTVCNEQQLYHYEIKVLEGCIFYIDDGPLMPSLEHIVWHYIRFGDGLPCKLKTAVSEDQRLIGLEIPTCGESEHDRDNKNNEGIGAYDEVGGASAPPLPSVSRPKLSKAKSPSVDDPLASVMIDKKHIHLGHELGQGEFGSVLKGIYTKHAALGRKKEVPVAVKTLLDSPVSDGGGSKDEFFSEARVMLELEHPNVVKLIGICDGPPVMIIQELVKMGSMLDYLWDNEDVINPKTDLILWAAQIANGMKYLEEKKFVHRDLAARNILLAEKTLAKISDFGLSRSVGSESDYYKASKGGRWPVKWYAPESVNYGTFSHASDVWSFGITLYEMFTFGEQPYGEKSGADVIQMLERGYRLERPPKCPVEIYNGVMLKCWSITPADRPTFTDLYKSFDSDPSFSRAKSIIHQPKKAHKRR